MARFPDISTQKRTKKNPLHIKNELKNGQHNFQKHVAGKQTLFINLTVFSM